MAFSGPGKVRREGAPFAGVSQVLRTRLFNYDVGEAAMKPEHRAWLEANLLPILRKSRNTMVHLWGTASRSGSDQFNRILSEKRANAIRDFLAQRGAKPGQIQFKGLGEAVAKAAGVADGTENPEERAVIVDVISPAAKAQFERLDPRFKDDGFDSETNPPFLSLATHPGEKALRLHGGESVRLRTTNPMVVKLIDPDTNFPVDELIVSNTERVEFLGMLPGTALIIGESVTGEQRTLLEVNTLEQIEVDIDFYFVEDSKGRLPVHRDNLFVEAMVKEASELWEDQANVSFRITKLEKLKIGKDLGEEVTNKETSAGKNFHHLSDMVKAPKRVNVFLVWEWNPDDGNADAEVNSLGNKFVIFEDELVAVSSPGRVLGHEIGHLFTLEHDKITPDVMMFGGAGLKNGRLRKHEILKGRKGI